MKIELKPLEETDREAFIKDNQLAFYYGAVEEFGKRDEHFEEGGEIISDKTINESIDAGDAYRIIADDEIAGGVIVKVEGNKGDLDILFVNPEAHSKGIGYKAWCEIEKMYPEVETWQTHTPYFETRNIHFYVNRCGFHIVEFFNQFHKFPSDETKEDDGDYEGFFRFEKYIPKKLH